MASFHPGFPGFLLYGQSIETGFENTMKIIVLGGDGLLQEVSDIARKYKDRCDLRRAKCVSYWNKDRAEASAGNT